MDIIWSVLESLHFESTTFWCQVVAFFVLHYSLKGLIYGRILEKRNERDSLIAGRLAEAEKLTAEAKARRNDYDQKIRAARHENQARLAEATQKAEEARAARVAEAREKAKAIVEEARETVGAERDKALESFDSQKDALSLSIVSRLLSSSMPEAESDKLLAKMRGAS